VFDFESGLELVALRGRAMQDAADAIRAQDGSPGSGMVALIGADESQASQICNLARGADVLVAANFNAPGQVVISGSIGACRRAIEIAAEHGLRAAPLPVAGAFHSPLMEPAAARLAAALANTPMRPPACPVASNVTGRAHETAPDSGRSIVDVIRLRLVEQLTMPVRWDEGCRWLAANVRGTWHELAPGKTLTGLMRRIDKTIKVETHDEPTAT
jgi:[acyl-carrier-protein] S-malonyltransferase